MADIRLKLRIKYGLRSEPTDAQIATWRDKTNDLIEADRISAEEAGHRAAQVVFPDYRTMLLKAEADTIEALLEEAAKK